ncbi:MAG TPA: DUF4032 domain-containing protein [Ktedonobacteraceae bacterium]|nr:DUF4032 domain-containing protein [Ktedonobacteraceae bacterium]
MVTNKGSIQFHLRQDDARRLAGLPWQEPLEKWAEQGVSLLTIRRGESRHPVVFVECEGIRYAIKETTPRMAEREVHNLREVVHRGVPALIPVGSVTVPGPSIALDTTGPGGLRQYLSGDRGYTVTRLALRVVPHALLYRLSLTRRTKQRLLSAVAVLMIELHEHGIYWGDPSLANTLIRIDGRRLLAIMADAETTELFSGPVSEGLRESDLAAFGESLAWQAEDLRQARGLPEDQQPLDETDFRYFRNRYRWLRREHARLADGGAHMSTLYQTQQFLERINRWSFSLLGMTGHALQEFTAILPGWYQNRIKELLHITIPRVYARRFYNMILGHQAIMSEKTGQEMSIEEAAHHWYSQYHLPALLLLRRVLTSSQDPMQAYFEVMLLKWKMSEKIGYEVPLDEAIVEWSMNQAKTGKLGSVDPALLAQIEDELEPTAQILDPTMIESEKLDPLLSTDERPLVHLSQSELETKLPEIVKKTRPDEQS